MNTISQSQQATISARTESAVNVNENTNSVSTFLKNAESNRLGITPMLLLVMSMIGGFAAASGIMDSWVELAAVAFPATIALAMILAIAPMRTIFISTSIAIVLDILVLIF